MDDFKSMNVDDLEEVKCILSKIVKKGKSLWKKFFVDKEEMEIVIKDDRKILRKVCEDVVVDVMRNIKGVKKKKFFLSRVCWKEYLK